MYGIDANDTQAFGNPSGSWDFNNGFDHGAYGWAIPQGELPTGIIGKLHFSFYTGFTIVPFRFTL